MYIIYIYIYIIYIYISAFLLGHCPLLITDHIFGKKVSLIVFRHKVYENLVCGAHFQFNNHDLFEKSRLGLNL